MGLDDERSPRETCYDSPATTAYQLTIVAQTYTAPRARSLRPGALLHASYRGSGREAGQIQAPSPGAGPRSNRARNAPLALSPLGRMHIPPPSEGSARPKKRNFSLDKAGRTCYKTVIFDTIAASAVRLGPVTKGNYGATQQSHACSICGGNSGPCAPHCGLFAAFGAWGRVSFGRAAAIWHSPEQARATGVAE